MTRKLKAALGATGALTAAAAGAWQAASRFELLGADLWILRGGLFLLGCVATAVAVWLYLRPRAAPAPRPSADEGQEIDAAMATARKRLAGSRAGKGGVANLPVVLLLGPTGSAKTTVVVRSGLDADLLAGEVFRGDAVASTRTINLWYSGRTVFAEAGGKLIADPTRWDRLVHNLQPGRVRAALAGGAQPSRTAVVCFSCEELLRGDTEAAGGAARTLRGRLADLANGLGVRLPVYVVFTKADRIPHFQEYVRNFSTEETREIFGVTLPLEPGGADTHTERTFKRVDRAFQRIFHSVASKRLKFLPRESQPESMAGAYEFPREFRKLIPLATQFLVELSRPSQLAISPVLRGFYFVGVRPIVVTEMAHEPVTLDSPAGESVPIGATSVFNPRQAHRAVLAKADPVPSSRKVPQWLFLERLFPEVVLRDRVALALTQGGRRVDLLRRLLLTGVAAAFAALSLGFSASYAGNRRLQAGVAEALRGMGDLPAAKDGLPAPEALNRLDRLRGEVSKLQSYDREGPPWRLRWGLYSGAALYPEASRRYFTEFERLLLGDTRDSLISALRTLPDNPTQASDYGGAYSTLKAYLITTSNPEKSTVDFLPPVLLQRWHGPTQVDPTRADLARRQFEFYAEELPRGNPYAVEVESRTVNHAREYLRRFTGTEPIYRSMLAATEKASPPIELARSVPGSAGLIRDNYIVPGQFTREGWSAMQAAFTDVDRFFKGEAWVIGDLAPVTADRDKVREQLRARYVREYVDHWRRFLAAAWVERFGGVQEGARRLGPLSSNQSPLLALFALVSRHTAVDTVLVAPAFQPVQVVAPPGDTTKFIGPSNEAYVNALVSLQASLDQIAKGTPDEADAAVSQAMGDASQAKLATRQLANKFRIDEAGNVHALVQRLMEAPILYVESALQAVGPAQLNGKGRAFCAPFQSLLAKHPFNASGTVAAGLDEVNALLQPGSGSLWSFVEGDLANYVTRQGTRFAEKPGSPVRISPAFLAFLGRAAEFSGSLYRGESAALALTLRPILSDAVPALTVNVDGRPARFTRTSAAAKKISWSAEDGREASLSAQMGGREREVLRYQGTWAIFKLFQQADWFPGDGSHVVEWRLPAQGSSTQQRAVFDVHLPGARPILKRDFFAGVSCGGRITR